MRLAVLDPLAMGAQVMEQSVYEATLQDRNFFERLLQFTNKVLESHFGTRVRNDPFGRAKVAVPRERP